ncbi:hypothetical protein PAXINDRAFT_20486 [Paxillus involutus ATCC 200175]|uniref:Uncharacterized protein n=1 Tax=Paxillus involutus ATCC 200175 TaxID=664439 RepID=A0A0C9T4I9_PAXIN|nr:hypothetical protein PAXINDRAFT_20486 [Paxillus involutus ATCC 200175]
MTDPQAHRHVKWPVWTPENPPTGPKANEDAKRPQNGPGHVDPTWPNPLPEAYEHAKQCTSTPDGPTAVPKAHEHGHVNPMSTPHGPPLPPGLRARQMATTWLNPFPQGPRACQTAHTHPSQPTHWPRTHQTAINDMSARQTAHIEHRQCTRCPYGLPQPSELAKRPTSTPECRPAVRKVHEHTRWPQNSVPIPPGRRACQTAHTHPRRAHPLSPRPTHFPQPHENMKRRTPSPDIAPSVPRPTSTPDFHQTRNDPPTHPSPSSVQHGGTSMPDGTPALPKANKQPR